jgi:uncharacterized membrane protein
MGATNNLIIFKLYYSNYSAFTESKNLIMGKVRNPYLKKDRLEMFCDGVFAIAITLLILEIKIPTHEDLLKAGGLYCYLIKIWPSYLSYVISFMAIGIYWSNHHWLFSFIKKTNHVFNLLNVITLMAIAVMPFTTAIMSEFILDPEYRNAAVTTYSIGYMLPIPAVTIVVLYAVYKHRLVDPQLSQNFINKLLFKLGTGFFTACVAIALSFNYPIVSLWLIGITFLAYLLPPDVPTFEDGKVFHEE